MYIFSSLTVLTDDEAEAAKTIEIVYPAYMLNMIFQELQGPIAWQRQISWNNIAG